MRVHRGSETQLPDSLIAAIDGTENAPAYRGTAYVVIEDMDLTSFGNRVPQFTFEVVRPAMPAGISSDPADSIRGVALVPGTGEFSLATTAVHYEFDGGARESANVNTPMEKADFRVTLGDMVEELPALRSASLVVSWFGDDLRCGSCKVRPKVEQNVHPSSPLRWSVSGLDRATAEAVDQVDGRPVYGGTPSDDSVVEAIRAMNEKGIDVTFYPFILMEQLSGNGLPDPWGGVEQPALPWRGRITTEVAPGRVGTTDLTPSATAEVKRFFGAARPEDFAVSTHDGGTRPVVAGPGEWSFRHFILHYAMLCAQAGGVEAFCIGSEMRSLTQIRGVGRSFPAVEELRKLAAEVRQILPEAKIGYAADWSEYFGYRPEGSNDVYFHLDPLWSDAAIDFIGIDNYVPLADWRDGDDHADAAAGSTRNLDYLQANIEGGEGYDWFYPDEAARATQRRMPIKDGAYGEPWVFRYKDIRSWWENRHYERVDGIRKGSPTGWIPSSKPIRFTEYGCAAVDKGANQPNKFVDPKSSESSLPHYSTGERDDAMQLQYLRAMIGYWTDASRNPDSPIYGGQMIDMDHSLVWAWDARPAPAFPELVEFWADGVNHARGHWFSGRAGLQPLAAVIAEVCERGGLNDVDVSRVEGIVRGYAPTGAATARAELQPLLMTYGVEVAERAGRLTFWMREAAAVTRLVPEDCVRGDGAFIEMQRSPAPEVGGRVRVHHVDSSGNFESRVGEAVMAGTNGLPVMETELPLALTRGEGIGVAERFLSESRVGRDSVDLVLPPSRRDLLVGDLFEVQGQSGTWRVDRLNEGTVRKVQAVRAERHVYRAAETMDDDLARTRPSVPLPCDVVFLDLPLLRGDEVPYAPYVATAATPWPGGVAIYSSPEDANYGLMRVAETPARIGRTETVLRSASASGWDRGPALLVRMTSGTMASRSEEAILSGENVMAIGDGSPNGWELLQFREAELVAPNLWALSERLRGRRGTEHAMRGEWPIGSRVVMIDRSLNQLEIGRDAIGLNRHYRFGPANLSIDHETYAHRVVGLGGGGLRPYSPAHLRLSLGEKVRATWLRRSRLVREDWDGTEIAVGEERLAFVVELRTADGRTVITTNVDETSIEWPRSDWEEIIGRRAKELRVAQVSADVGPGGFASLQI
jgi:hypothetical protein